MLPVMSSLKTGLNGDIAKEKKKARVVVAVGGSTGGTRASENIIANLPADLSAAVIVCLHMPPRFTSMFARRLDELSKLSVAEAGEGDFLVEGTALIAPGGFHLIISGQKVVLRLDKEVHHLRPAIDVMLKSLADSDYRVIAVILTGMGMDGTEGVKYLKLCKPESIILVQDPETATIPSMPRSIVASGCYHEIVSLTDLPARIVKYARDLAANEY